LSAATQYQGNLDRKYYHGTMVSTVLLLHKYGRCVLL